MPATPLPWRNPLDLAQVMAKNTEEEMIFLHSSRNSQNHTKSILAFDPLSHFTTLTEIEYYLSQKPQNNYFHNSIYGYIGYGVKNQLEKVPHDAKGRFNLPDLNFILFKHVLVWDYEQHTLTLYSESPSNYVMDNIDCQTPKNSCKAEAISSNMSKSEYLLKVSRIKEYIADGVLSQANLTRKFYGKYSRFSDSFEFFKNLTVFSPSDYSSFIKLSDCCIISSSPEQFLRIDNTGYVTSSPIKGTAHNTLNPTSNSFHNSEKDRAENLMIVDLMRHDFAKGCITGSIKVPELYSITSHTTLQHMHSTVTGQKRGEITAFQFALNCFPPGSMTGTPKIKAMEICSELEIVERGVYSGAIGWFAPDGSCDLSVVIRTVITNGKEFEFQVGGGIVHDSEPEKEWEETLLKAKGIALAFNIDSHLLSDI